mmetsp:Transcript_44704/g.124005  ORF Transcript_44704/g.124005 Transcript_44704/m.124005 type:complete len:521 (+) Transcript_44704:2-1564(+)
MRLLSIPRQSSSLSDLRNLISDGVQKSDTVVLLATKGVLSRPWCLIELLETARRDIPVVIVQVANGEFTYEGARTFTENFEGEMAKLNPMGLDFLERRIGTDFDDVQQAIFRALDENEEHPLQFDSSAGDNTMVAAMKDVVERMARVTARTIRWLGDTEELNSRRAARKRSTSFRKPSLKMSISLSSKSLQASLAGQVKKGARFSAESLARSSTLRRGSGGSFKRSSRDSAEVVNEESAIFVCCSRDDAVRHARVLRSELSVRLGRGCAVGGGHTSAAFVSRSEVFVVMLTKKLLTNPDCLFEIFMALQYRLPIVSVSITGGGYDYAEASRVYADLPAALERKKTGSAAKLKERLPESVTVASVGESLHATLTAIIALSWSPAASKNQLDAVVDDITSRMPKKKRHGNRALHLDAAVDDALAGTPRKRRVGNTKTPWASQVELTRTSSAICLRDGSAPDRSASGVGLRSRRSWADRRSFTDAPVRTPSQVGHGVETSSIRPLSVLELAAMQESSGHGSRE